MEHLKAMPAKPNSSMTPQRFQEIRVLFESVVKQSEDERFDSLQSLRERDPEMAMEVGKLMAAYQRRADFIETPIGRFSGDDQSTVSGEPNHGLIGPYRLLAVIGEGGMGQVWQAEQTHPIRRIVALKLIKEGMDTREVVRRFESERQALAVMCHPAIAKVYDAGHTPAGRPYFAMEYVEGTALTKYCDEHELSIRDRLSLFIKICEGVQHAHRKAIIHRDLKPSNVLVAEVDGRPLPKIIDFGVARAISPDATDDAAVTRLGAILGTPDYMSPEQASIGANNLDTRTDVYSLGALLFELLTGSVPHDVKALPLLEALRKIREEPAQRPSVRYRLLGLDPEVARKRHSAPSILYRELQGDLDTVVLKSLKRNPENRYESASELAADVGRYLRHSPIVARPASLLYLTRMYVRRHWLAVAGVGIALALATAFVVWQNIELHRITWERNRADRIAQFMTDMFRVSDPSESRGNQITAREILDRSSSGIGKGLAGDPDLQAELMGAMGRVYYGLGLYQRAEALFRHSLDLRRKLAGPSSLDSAQSMHDLAMAVRANGSRTEAKRLDLAALEIRKRILGPEHRDTLKSMNSLADDFEREGSYGEARRLQEAVYESDLRVLGPEHSDTLVAMENLGESLYSEGRLRTAESYARGVLKIQRRKLGSDHPETLGTIHLLGAVLSDQGRHSEAEALFRELLSTRTRVLGQSHPDTLRAMKALAVSLDWEGRFAEAEELDRQVVKSQEKTLGPGDPTLLLSVSDLAHIIADQGRLEEAENMGRNALEKSVRSLGAENPKTLFLASAFASLLLLRGSLDEAERMALQTRAAQLRVLGKDHAQTACTTYTLARIKARMGHGAEALTLMREAVEHGLSPGYLRKIEREPNLASVREDPAFRALVVDVRQRLSQDQE